MLKRQEGRREGKEGIQLFKTFLCLLDKTSRQLGFRDTRGSVNQFSLICLIKPSRSQGEAKKLMASYFVICDAELLPTCDLHGCHALILSPEVSGFIAFLFCRRSVKKSGFPVIMAKADFVVCGREKRQTCHRVQWSRPLRQFSYTRAGLTSQRFIILWRNLVKFMRLLGLF